MRNAKLDVDDHEHPWYCLKIDIEKFFYHVSHAEALDMFRPITDDERFIELMSTIVNNTELHTKMQIVDRDEGGN